MPLWRKGIYEKTYSISNIYLFLFVKKDFSGDSPFMCLLMGLLCQGRQFFCKGNCAQSPASWLPSLYFLRIFPKPPKWLSALFPTCCQVMCPRKRAVNEFFVWLLLRPSTCCTGTHCPPYGKNARVSGEGITPTPILSWSTGHR